jgi:putative acetyltransferase
VKAVIMSLEIIEYEPQYQQDFFRLNAAWIEPNFGLEKEDIDFLQNPQTEILDKGGVIFFAKYQGNIVGTCGLFKMADDTYELIRTAVDTNYQGLGAGKAIIEHAIQWARNQQAKHVILESSTKPVNAKALQLYERLGFQHYEPKPEHRSALQRADVWMKMELTDKEDECLSVSL